MELTKRQTSIEYLSFVLTWLVIFNHIAFIFSPIGAYATLVRTNGLNPIFDFIITYAYTFFIFTFFFFIAAIFCLKSLAKGPFKSMVKEGFDPLTIPFTIGWLFVYDLGFLWVRVLEGLPTRAPYASFFINQFRQRYQAGNLRFSWFLFLIQTTLILVFFYHPNLIDRFKVISFKLFDKAVSLIHRFIFFVIVSCLSLVYFTADLLFVNIFRPLSHEILGYIS
jgi:hypothetical protein